MHQSCRTALGGFLGCLQNGPAAFAGGFPGLVYLGGPTGYAINPARDLGPRIAYALLPIQGKGKADWGYSWIPVFAPILGGVLGALLFVIVGF